MESKVVHGGHGMEGVTEENKEQLKKERELQKKLKKQKQKELELLEEKRKKEEEMLFVQGNYDSLQQEVESMREIMEKLRDKYKKAQAEIKDMQREQQGEKEELLDIIRSQEKIVKFSNKVISILLTDHELYKLNEKAKWDDERLEWNIPLFTLNTKTREIAFPTINAKQRVEQMKEDRDLIIDEHSMIRDKEVDQFKQPHLASGNKPENAKIRKGGKSLADYSDENFSMGHD